MKRLSTPVVAATLTLLSLGLTAPGCATIRQSDTDLRSQMLTWTPIGTPKESTLAAIHQHWPKARTIIGRAPNGQERIAAKLGDYAALSTFPFLFRKSVFATWRFDPDGTLTDIEIQREIEAL